MKRLITAALLSLAAGYAAAAPNQFAADCYFYPGCHLGQTPTSSGAGGGPGSTSASGGPRTGARQAAARETPAESSDSGMPGAAPGGISRPLKSQQNPQWEGCYFYPGC